MKHSLLFAVAAGGALLAQAEVMDRPTGFKVGQRMTVRPYVALYYTWDSNIDSAKKSSVHDRDASSWNINPGLTFDYQAENWSLSGGLYYQNHAFCKNSSSLDQDSYGENVSFNWASSKESDKGWSLILTETYAKISQDDDMSNHGGRGLGRDSEQIGVNGALQRQFNEQWHAGVDGSYSFLEYDNDSKKYAPMYGWKRWTAGGQIGFVASRWTDILIAANYQGYDQDNNVDRGGELGEAKGRYISSDSKGWSLSAGLGSHATERISYRVMGGWSHFEYGGGVYDTDGFTYSVAGNWQMSDDWTMMLMGSSYYQPSETSYGSAQRNDCVSWGLAHSMVRGKLNATFDLNYRHQTSKYAEYEASGYDEDILTARLGFNYILNRFLSVFTSAEYQIYWADTSAMEGDYDYDRWRLSLGLRLTY